MSHFLKFFSFGIWQTSLSQVTLLVKDVNESNMQSRYFVFSPMSKDFLQKGVNVWNDVIMYN